MLTDLLCLEMLDGQLHSSTASKDKAHKALPFGRRAGSSLGKLNMKYMNLHLFMKDHQWPSWPETSNLTIRDAKSQNADPSAVPLEPPVLNQPPFYRVWTLRFEPQGQHCQSQQHCQATKRLQNTPRLVGHVIYLDCKSANLFPQHHFCVASQFAPSLNVAVRQGRTRRWHNCGIAACTSLPIVWHQAPPVTVALSLLRLAPWFGSFVFPSHATFPPRPRLQLSPAQVRSLHLVTCGLWPSSKKDADRQLRYFALSWELEQNMHLEQSMKVCAMYIPMPLRRSTDQPRLLFCEEICDVILACTKSPFTADPSSLFIFQVVRLFHKNSYLAMDSRKVGYIMIYHCRICR